MQHNLRIRLHNKLLITKTILWATMATFFISFTVTDYVLAKISLRKKDKVLTDNVSLLKRWISISHAPNSPDLNPEDYNIWLEMWQWVHQTKFHNAKELNQCMPTHDTQLMSVGRIRSCACIRVIGRPFGHLVRSISSICSASVCIFCKN